MEWVKDALCRGRSDIEWLGDFVTPAAAAVCAVCPVAVECLNYALDNHENKCDAGVWGGTSPQERYAIRRGRGQR